MEKVASLADMPEDRGLCVEVAREKILLVRDGDAVRAYSAICPHAGAPLEEGAICHGRIVCPWHKGAFRVSDGALCEPPALDGLERYPVRVQDDEIFVGAEAERQPMPAAKADERTFAIVGAGAAGGAAAAALREFGFNGRLVMIGRERGLPFDRTSLSKFVIAGEMKPEETPLLKPQAFYDEQRIEIVDGDVVRCDVTARGLALADGRRMTFAQALLAPGSEAKKLDIPGFDKPGVHWLRSRDDAAAILADLGPGARAVIVGGSFIGLEVASCLRAQRASVTVVSPDEVPFARQFGDRVGRSLRALHETNGVVFEKGKPIALNGEARVSSVTLDDGRILAADLVVVGVGVLPAASFVKGVELREDGGLPVDAGMRVADGVYAAGDVAAFPFAATGGRIRVEHWRVAQQHARVAAANMVGRRATFDAPPFFWTYHYGQNFEYLGHAEGWDEEVICGDLENQAFVAFLLKGGFVAAAIACGRQRLTAVLAERMRAPLSQDDALRLATQIGD
jgi:apoptosis-inducing factor 3